MGYNIEISFNIYKNSSISELKYNLIEIAENNYCYPYNDNLSTFYEMEYGLTTAEKRNHCVMTFNFDNSKIIYLIKFLKKIKNLKPFHIETIYDDTKIIYASKYYQSIMDKTFAENYKQKNKLSDNFNSTDNLILLNIDK